ncbi:methyltransferase C-terminal domain-containing protein [Amycolatopsis acidiphila]|uniref:Transferase n=1 Tax=Amycolatopsis acidiphila TaxID=715473 RepID=A0A558AKB4_9PSEU|nr:methyltransferase domain-containing protein [Amycolatopsis acidiphila]TVT24702.1 transferase [Amycolatopsis acidiphila]UIJ62668.1 methyltransferase C-terminal domain-containing protein [Amycolatopsis acidiphila]GHG63499.1 transferase [Amycolatopsis acidiphila]
MPSCRACGAAAGDLVLDLGEQPPCDLFPPAGDPGPDPLFPLRMWLCGRCSLAQLVEDPGTKEEPAGVEPRALTEQAADAVRALAGAGLVRPGASVAEYGSPHGGSWLPLLRAEGMREAAPDEPADLVIDCFGLMHDADQRAAMAARAARLAPGATLVMQFHSLASILAQGQWNALRHGHFAYYSLPSASALAGSAGLRPGRSWSFPLYGGTVLLELSRDGAPDAGTEERTRREVAAGVTDSARVAGLGRAARDGAARLRAQLTDVADAGKRVLGYGAASRAAALLRHAGIDSGLLPAIVDISAVKHGRRMPASAIPIVPPDFLRSDLPDVLLLFVPDLLAEVRAAFPALDEHGCEWILT